MLGIVALTIFAEMVAPSAMPPASPAQTAKTPYPTMAAVHQYLSPDDDTEIALARSAAPKSISDGAKILVLGRAGYKTAVEGGNGFVCLVQRSWTAGIDDPDFWNPKLRAPNCFNPPAVRTYVPIILLKTRLVLAGKSKSEMFQAVASALDSKELLPPEPGAMTYMMSKQQYVSDEGKSWHPHLMFFVPRTAAEGWGANLPGSPIIAADDPEDRLTVFLIPVRRWSDGTADPPAPN
jgi:hypothetical protein